ncbi:TniQ family protein [Thalassotalea sp. SU-HH00458]|uniref:TniQ family protein n=1 Tax=Thalassotalea sp. SU-HH00458 TaxID=3127657 RepID=UPI0033655A38
MLPKWYFLFGAFLKRSYTFGSIFLLNNSGSNNMPIKALAPKPYEHIYSYLVRMCISNRFSSLPDMYSYLGLSGEFRRNSSCFLTDFSSLKSIASSMGIDEELLINLLPKSNKEMTTYCSHSVPTDILCHEHFRCCPKCLLEDGYIPAYQAFKPITFCIKHSSSIVDKWDDGDIYIDWNDQNLFERISNSEYRKECITSSEEVLAKQLYLVLQRPFVDDLPEVFGMMDTSNFLLLYLFYYKHSYREYDKPDSRAWFDCYQNICCYPFAVFDFIETFHELEQEFSFKDFSVIYPDIYRDLYRGPYSSSYAYMKLKALLEMQLTGDHHD